MQTLQRPGAQHRAVTHEKPPFQKRHGGSCGDGRIAQSYFASRFAAITNLFSTRRRATLLRLFMGHRRRLKFEASTHMGAVSQLAVAEPMGARIDVIFWAVSGLGTT